MLNGRYSSTMNFWKHTGMGWLSNAVMASGAVFTLVSLHIQQITRRSEFLPHCRKTRTHILLRILLAGIRNLGRCPCPRCLVQLDRVPNMGMPRDMTQRVSLARVDDVKRRSRIKAAREAIYVMNYSINSSAVETLLKEDSLVPTVVSFSSVFCVLLCPYSSISECVFGQALLHQIQYV
jgi:hypothetical protein